MKKKLEDIKKLCVFDFDNTLMVTPIRKVGVPMWEEYYGEKYPSKSWWGEPYSLDLDVYKDYIKPNNDVLFDFRRNINKKDTLVIMLTHRLPKLSKYVEKVLDKFNIEFDDRLYRRSYFLTKGDDIGEYIGNLPNLEEIEVWEDRETEIDAINDWFYKIEPWVKFKLKINEIKT